MKINFKLKLIATALLLSGSIASLEAAPNRNHTNKSIDPITRAEVAKIQKHLRKIELKRYIGPRSSYVRFQPVKKSFSREKTNKLQVTATAYTSHVNQTDSTPDIAAWGDKLRPGIKAIAVSRDLLEVYGLKHRSKVKIKGLPGEYVVLDKMNKRWRKKIDIYMGKDLSKAYRWGRRKVELQWSI